MRRKPCHVSRTAQGCGRCGIADLCIGQRNASQSVRENPCVGHDLVRIDLAVLRNDVLRRRGVVSVNGGDGRLAGTERLVEVFGKGDVQLRFQRLGFRAILVCVAERIRRIDVCPDADASLRLRDVEEVLPLRVADQKVTALVALSRMGSKTLVAIGSCFGVSS